MLVFCNLFLSKVIKFPMFSNTGPSLYLLMST